MSAISRLFHAATPRLIIRTAWLRAAATSVPAPHHNGHPDLHYERYWSRDNTIKQQVGGDTPSRFLFGRLSHAYEVYPIICLCGLWFFAFIAITYLSIRKSEVWLDRGQKKAPWDWERIRNNYYKNHTVLFDMSGKSHKRLYVMEKLQDEMAEAAKKRQKS